MDRRILAVTLMELLIAIALIGLVVLGSSSILLFSRVQVLTTDRRAQVQNETSYILDHMSKQIHRAIGNERVYGDNTVIDTGDSTGDNETRRVKIYIEASGNGIRENEISNPQPDEDHWIAYRFYDKFNPQVPKRNRIEYCGRCQNKSCNNCASGWETLGLSVASTIQSFTITKPGDNTLTDNFLSIAVTTRWDPNQAASLNNPEVTMRTRIKMPSVSTN